MDDERHAPPARRRILEGLGAAVVVSLAGCRSFSGPQTSTGRSARITISIDNADDVSRGYEVEVNWGENNRSIFTGVLPPGTADSEMVAVTGTAPESAQFLIDAPNSAQSGTWSPSECPDYRVEAVIETGNPSFETSCQA